MKRVEVKIIFDFPENQHEDLKDLAINELRKIIYHYENIIDRVSQLRGTEDHIKKLDNKISQIEKAIDNAEFQVFDAFD